MMHISRCTSLKNDETTKRSWTAASAFLILMIVCFHLSFSSSFFFVGDNLRRCSFLCSPIFFPAPFTSNIACVFNARYKRVHLRYQLAGWVRMRTRMGVRWATRNVLIHFVCSCRSWENECVEKLHRQCICLSWKLLACFTLCLSWVVWRSCVRYWNGFLLYFNLYFLVSLRSERCFLLEAGSIFAVFFLAVQTQGVMTS